MKLPALPLDLAKLKYIKVRYNKYPEIKNDEEVYPDFVQKENLELLYYGEQFEDILLNVMDQIGIPSEKDYIEALIFFMENDEFKDFLVELGIKA